MKKAATTNSDFQLALLDWRNTPTEGFKILPAQKFFGTHETHQNTVSDFKRTPVTQVQLVRDIRERKLERKEVQNRYQPKC